VKELIAYGKERPNTLNFGSSGIGGIGHLAGELFAWKAGFKMVHVPYKGAGPALVDMVGGRIQLGFTATISGMPHVRAGKLVVLGVSSARRAPSLPDIPTIAEAGLQGFDLVNWYGIFAPGATPPAILSTLHREVTGVLGSQDMQSLLAKDGADAAPSSSLSAFRRVFDDELVRWEGYVRLPGFAEALKQQ
jgi:tripartite-type tricarboxylate transporter receptor subunit TctC